MTAAVVLGPLVTPQSDGSFTGWGIGDLASLCCSLLLVLSGALRLRDRQDIARAATRSERRRLSHELHDGVLQELTLIQLEVSLLPLDEGNRGRILHACDRALAEARSSLEGLRMDRGSSLAPALRDRTTELAELHGIEVELWLDETVKADAGQQHALLRIAGEAITNAARHGGATKITVLLEQHGATRRLHIEDDGTGFDATSARPQGFGLTSMRERAESLPGTLEIDSRTATGSRVMVAW